MNLPPAYPISLPGLSRESLEKWAKGLLDAGATLVQYREKKRGDGELFSNAEMLSRLFGQYSATLIINDRADIALMAKAGGIHLGDEDLPPAEVRKLLGDKAVIGYSTHDPDEAKDAAALPVDYIALGPVYETGSKSNTRPLVSETVKKEVVTSSVKPVVAIGGITVERARELWNIGFKSVAAIQAFAEEPGRSYREFLKAYENR